MGLKNVIENVSVEIVLEVIGAGFVIGWFIVFVFDGGCMELFEIWAKTVCG